MEHVRWWPQPERQRKGVEGRGPGKGETHGEGQAWVSGVRGSSLWVRLFYKGSAECRAVCVCVCMCVRERVCACVLEKQQWE